MTLTDIPGLLVGHATDEEHRTGCTVILCPEGAVPGGEVVGFAPGTRETDLLQPHTRTEEIHGLLLTGGSAYGLAAATGVVRWLTERGYGLETIWARVPLVPGAVVYDLFYNRSLGKPDEAMGYQAAMNASTDPVRMGCIGAGTGITAGKLAGIDRAMKSGLGSAGIEACGVKVAALAVPNPLGDVVDPDTGEVLAGVRTLDGKGYAGAVSVIQAGESFFSLLAGTNTVLGLVATDAKLNKVQTSRVAKMAAAGISRAIRPAHTMWDGDYVFALSTGQGPEVDETVVGVLAAEVLGRAIAEGAKAAVTVPRQSEVVPEMPAYRDMRRP